MCGSPLRLSLIPPLGDVLRRFPEFFSEQPALHFLSEGRQTGLDSELNSSDSGRGRRGDRRRKSRGAELRLGFHCGSSLQVVNESKVLPVGYSVDRMSPPPLVLSRPPGPDMFLTRGLAVKDGEGTQNSDFEKTQKTKRDFSD